MKREDGVCVAAARCSSIMPLARSGELPPADAKVRDGRGLSNPRDRRLSGEIFNFSQKSSCTGEPS